MFCGEWLIYSIAALFCWGLMNVCDTYFVGSGRIYQNPHEGLMISALFKTLGAFTGAIVFFPLVIQIMPFNALLAVAGGAVLAAAYYFYFLAVFYHNDLSLIQLIWNLSVPVVAVLAWLTLDETLHARSYAGMTIVFLGALALTCSRDAFRCNPYSFFLYMLPLIILYSVSEVLMKYLEAGRGVSFAQSFPFFCLGQAGAGIIIWGFRRKQIKGHRRLRQMIQDNGFWFVFSECLELAGLFFMQLSIAKTPSISYHAMMESFMPVIVIFLTGATAAVLNRFGRGEILKNIYANHLSSGLTSKIIITLVMMAGVYLMD